MLKALELEKLNLYKEIYHEEPTHVRSIMVEIQNKVCPRHELEKSNLHKEMYQGRGTKNIIKAQVRKI